MNMLRVWGGGVYESDTFYRLADELGIMVWQDFMFACAMYPVGDDFLRSVDAEVRQQHRRLSHHPSVVLWAGNNENEAALRGNWYQTRGPLFERYHRDYVKLYVDTVRAAVRDEGSAVPFAVSSPSNGAESEAEDFLAKNPYSSLFGDDHHYDYVSDAWNPAVFHNTRFGSEYGFMSWPSRHTMAAATDAEHADEDLALGSRLAEHRQHHPGGNAEMALQILQHLPLPTHFNDSEHFDTFAYLSQIYQAMATKSETEFLRRSRYLLSPRGEGRTMGALYWQLNDVWQAPSWASIDFAGRWKMLHHYAVDFLAPLIVSPHLEGDTLHVDVISDAVDPDGGAVLVRTDVFAMDSFAPRSQRLDAWSRGSSPRAYSAPLRSLLDQAGCSSSAARWACLIRFRLLSENNTVLAPDNFLFPRSPRDHAMPTARLQVSDVRGPLNGTAHQRRDFSLRLSASSPAAFVWLEAGPLRGRFSRNGFHVTEAAPAELRFHTDEDTTAAELARHLSVRALNGALASR
ncbi:beta-mannosidase, partial [Frankliniella occidentalis]|uniref:beta-mannosidase n=1 Tax=Frankliniella occidentalis TaxID=133901 RepID=A0A9C6XCJ0_FRAOC